MESLNHHHSCLLLSGATSHFAGDFRVCHVGMCQKWGDHRERSGAAQSKFRHKATKTSGVLGKSYPDLPIGFLSAQHVQALEKRGESRASWDRWNIMEQLCVWGVRRSPEFSNLILDPLGHRNPLSVGINRMLWASSKSPGHFWDFWPGTVSSACILSHCHMASFGSEGRGVGQTEIPLTPAPAYICILFVAEFLFFPKIWVQGLDRTRTHLKTVVTLSKFNSLGTQYTTQPKFAASDRFVLPKNTPKKI